MSEPPPCETSTANRPTLPASHRQHRTAPATRFVRTNECYSVVVSSANVDGGGTDIVIRKADPADLPALGRLGASLVRLHHGYDRARFMAPAGSIEEGYAWFLGTQLDEAEAVVFVAERAGGVVGYAYAGLEPLSWQELREAAGFVHDLVVDETQRRQGIASRLLEAAADWLEAHGAPRVMRWTAEKNDAAQRLFQRRGFRRTMVEMTRERKAGGGDGAAVVSPPKD